MAALTSIALIVLGFLFVCPILIRPDQARGAVEFLDSTHVQLISGVSLAMLFSTRLFWVAFEKHEKIVKELKAKLGEIKEAQEYGEAQNALEHLIDEGAILRRRALNRNTMPSAKEYNRWHDETRRCLKRYLNDFAEGEFIRAEALSDFAGRHRRVVTLDRKVTVLRQITKDVKSYAKAEPREN